MNLVVLKCQVPGEVVNHVEHYSFLLLYSAMGSTWNVTGSLSIEKAENK